MTRINTNVSSLVAQQRLQRSNNDLNLALQRLSTGLRINTGKDDPAGLIASEGLRSDITSVGAAITNTQRANQVIATTDSGLGQISSLLNDIRGLATEAANSGALSAEQIAANQLQLDSSLEAINRISATTSFQGRKLIDGSLDFITNGGANFDKLSNLGIQQANLGTAASLAVAINVTTAATQAQVDITNVPAATGAVNATTNLTLSSAERQAVFTLTFDTTTTASITVTAVNGGAAEDADGNGITVVLVQDATTAGGVDSVAYVDGTNTLTVNADFASGTLENTEIAAAIQASNGGLDFTASAAPANTNLVAADVGSYATGTGITYTTSGRDAGSHAFIVTADTAGAAANGVTVTIQESASIANNSVVASINGSGNIVADVRGTVTKAAIVAAIDGLAGYSVSSTSATGDVNYIESADTPPGVATLAGGIDASGGLAQDVVFELSGLNGSEIFSFETGASISQLETAIDALSDSTGVTATVSGTTLQLISSAYGSEAFTNIRIVSEGAGGTFTTAIGTDERDTGTDVVATVNGITALGRGNRLSINTSVLDLSTSVEAAFTGTSNFTITGGGALFQLGPDVVSAQQARIGVQSVNTARLGGVSGLLYQLGSGGTAALDTDANLAATITDEAITQVTSLRGRLGAFQKTTLESNLVALNDTLANLTEAQAEIRDADFASESARLTRAQILVQAGTSVLAIANSNPQNALALLR